MKNVTGSSVDLTVNLNNLHKIPRYQNFSHCVRGALRKRFNTISVTYEAFAFLLFTPVNLPGDDGNGEKTAVAPGSETIEEEVGSIRPGNSRSDTVDTRVDIPYDGRHSVAMGSHRFWWSPKVLLPRSRDQRPASPIRNSGPGMRYGLSRED